MNDVDYTSDLAERGKTVGLALRELGVSGSRADDCATIYFNTLSAMVTAARNIKFFGNKVPTVEISDLEGAYLGALVTRNGQEWGKIWLQKGNELRFRFEYDTEDPQVHTKGDFEV